jgi:hypothetical protein
MRMVRISAYDGVRAANPALRAVSFRFLSGVEKRRRVAAANMNSYFIDGFTRSLDIGRVVLPKATA